LKPSRILVIKLRAIGDVVLSTAVLPNLKAACPEAEIHFLTEKASAPVIENNPHVDRVWILPSQDKSLSRMKHTLSFLHRIRKQKYDLVFDLFGNPRSAFITWVSGSPVRVGYRFRGRVLAYNRRVDPRGDRVHEVDFNLDALRAQGIPILSSKPEFYFGPEDARRIDTWIKQEFASSDFLVAIHPWGSWEAKRWPPARFAELATRLIRSLNARVIVLWGPGEREHAEEVRSLSEETLTLAPPTTLGELGALLSRCGLVVANDSGPMHIAAAAGVPTAGLFGPTNPDLQGPYGPNGLAVYRKELSCIGCNRLQCPDGSCMNDLTVDQVESEIADFLNRMNDPPSISKNRKPVKMDVF
jgi:heptosyltransferase-3